MQKAKTSSVLDGVLGFFFVDFRYFMQSFYYKSYREYKGGKEDLSMESINEETVNLCDKLSSALMENHFLARTNIYLDADLLFDYKLAAILLHITTPEIYAHVMKCLPDYLNAPTLECAKFFPELELTEEMVTDYIGDPANSTLVATAVPATGLMYGLKTFLSLIRQSNRAAESDEPLTITINQKLAPMHAHQKKLIRAAAEAVDPNATVNFVSFKTWDEIPKGLLMSQQIIGVYDLQDFVREGTTSQKMMRAVTEMSQITIMALFQITTGLKEEDWEMAVQNTEGVMQLVCDKFTFLHRSISPDSLFLPQREEKGN